MEKKAIKLITNAEYSNGVIHLWALFSLHSKFHREQSSHTQEISSKIIAWLYSNVTRVIYANMKVNSA